ncbi:DUF5131 family protein [Brachyspira pilosicoli]|uniref:DUF5131 family protein n=1 Tax=Brachyspira pilosicoli TaxID=52584 RepID=UPI001C66384B|nr:DUF5131 family protein [Brachyspira pilosicoli]MBW5398456.1 DUF5131 family protein [Brachyspira pilosicoli]
MYTAFNLKINEIDFSNTEYFYTKEDFFNELYYNFSSILKKEGYIKQARNIHEYNKDELKIKVHDKINNFITNGGKIDSKIIEEDWILNIKEACKKSKTAFFFKQWGGVNKKKNGRILQGRTWNAIPHYAL